MLSVAKQPSFMALNHVWYASCNGNCECVTSQMCDLSASDAAMAPAPRMTKLALLLQLQDGGWQVVKLFQSKSRLLTYGTLACAS